MKRLLYVFVLMLGVFAALPQDVFGQGSTTAAISGSVRDEAGEALPGATIQAVHTPTGSRYGNITNAEGLFTLRNLNVGGPYKITVSFVGYQNKELDNIFLSLGQTQRLNIVLSEAAQELEAIEITAAENDVMDGARTGASTIVGKEAVEAMPTVSRSISDFARTTPQARVTDGGGLTIAGQNNRYNSISIDGAVNNDVFGLSDQGTNGGQAGISPISLDAIEQFQIVLAPFDVRQGGFSGGGINAVTRSGSNKFEGSAYYLFRNEGLAGKTPTDNPDAERERLADFSANITGVRVGGPLIKDKLFFFVNGEMERQQTPQPFEFSQYRGNATQSDLDGLRNFLRTEYGYDAGGYLDNTAETNSNKFFVRLDWNINDKHKLMLRHSYTQGENIGARASSSNSINFYNNGVLFPTTTNSSALELKSQFGNDMANSLTVGFTAVRDDRDPMGGDFPRVVINDGAGRIFFGSEAFSTANQLNQDILTITDNFNIFKGKHTITIGTHNEFYSTYNLFIRQNYGEYTFANLNDFITGQPATNYSRSYSLVDDVTGDGSAAAAEFTGTQLGFYVQDEYAASDKLNVTFGVRVDIPIFSDPTESTGFNDSTLTKIQQYYPELGGRIESGKLWGTPLLFSPRLGFNYDVMGDRSLQIRGGIGIFTSRIPLVWPGGAYNNNGLTVGGMRSDSQTFNPDPFNQPTSPVALPSGQMDLFVDDFKLPQVLRASLAVDKTLPWGMVGTLEGVYSKTLNNVLYYNVNVKPSTENYAGVDDRPVYDRRDAIESDYTRIMVGDNTNKGYSYNVTAQVQKPFANGFTGNVAYTFGRAMAVNDGTSSQNSSQWRYTENVRGKNDLDLSYSDFDLGSRVTAFLSYRKEYLGFAATTVSLFYEGRSGQRYSYIYGGGVVTRNRGQVANDDTGSSSTQADLIYVPANQGEINLIDITDDAGNITLSAEEQWNNLNQFIENDDYLKERRGDYAERNGARLPFVSILDFRLLQDFYLERGNGSKHNLQLSLDIFNFTNFLNKDWGRRYFMGNDNFTLLNHEGTNADGELQYTYTGTNGDEDIWSIDDRGINSSRWQMQIGIRYSF